MSKDFVNQYAKALFEVAEDTKTKNRFLDEIRVVEDVITQDPNVFMFFKAIDIPAADKNKVLAKSLEGSSISKDVLNTVLLIIEREKIAFLSKIVLAYQSLNDEANGVVRGTVRSTHELEGPQRKAMAEKIESVLNKKVILDYVQDSKVIGGEKAQVGSYTFDDTFETHLKKMKDQINRRTH